MSRAAYDSVLANASPTDLARVHEIATTYGLSPDAPEWTIVALFREGGIVELRDLLSRLENLAPKISEEVFANARQLCVDDLADRTAFEKREKNAREQEKADAINALEELQAAIISDVTKNAALETIKMLLSSINGELQKKTDAAVVASLRNQSSSFELFVFLLYTISATSFDTWLWITSHRVSVIFIGFSFIIWIAIAAITVLKPALANIRK